MSQPKWVQVQQKTFTRCNTFLVERDIQVVDLIKDLNDGIKLHALLEILSGETIKPKVKKNAKMKLQKIENLNTSFNFLKMKDIKLVNISAEDVYDGKTNLILGLIWTLILRFQIQQAMEEEDDRSSVRKDLLDWCNRALNPQGVFVKNFQADWSDGAAFAGLVNYCRGNPEFNLKNMNRDDRNEKLKNLSNAFDKAEDFFGFPQLLEAEDTCDCPDDLSIMTYVSYFRGYKTENEACASKCVAYGPGLKDAITQEFATYTVELRNDEGERVKLGGANVTGELVCGDAKVKALCHDNGDGTYSCKYKCTVPGTYELAVKVDGGHVQQSPFHPEVVAGSADPLQSTANPKTPVPAGELTEFDVVTRDSNGNQKPTGDEKVEAVLKGPAQINADVEDKNDGTYHAKYTPEKAGTYQLFVTIEAANIKDVPFTIEVVPAAADAASSYCEGDGLSKATPDADATFRVITVDRFGNKCTEGGFKVTSALHNDQNKVEVAVVDNNDGTYSASYRAKKHGKYTLDVAIGGANVKDAPFTVTVEPGKAFAGNCALEGDSKVVAGDTGTFKVSVRDESHNLRVGGGDNVAAALNGGDAVEVKVDDKKDGTYDGSYVPQKAGKYTLDVKLDGTALPDSPLQVEVVAGAADATQTTAEGEGLSAASTDKEATFTVTTRDRFGNVCGDGGADVQAELVGANDEKVAVKVDDKKDGTYACAYHATKAGDYTLKVTLANEKIKDAPFSVKVSAGAASAANTDADGDGLRTVVAGEEGKFTVTTKDAHGNQLPSGGANVSAKLDGPSSDAAVTVVDSNDGTYACSYVPKKVGAHKLNVLLDGAAINGSPFAVQVVPAKASAAHTEASGDGISKASTEAPAHFKVQTKDEFGNECADGGANITAELVNDDGVKVPGTVKDNGDGTYDVEYQPTVTGTYRLEVKLDDENIKDAPFSVDVSAGKASGGKSTADGDGLKRVVAGTEGVFVVTARDQHGNALADGGANVEAEASGPETVKVAVDDKKDGTYRCTYVPTKVGAYKLGVKLDSDAIENSPFDVEVVPAAPSADNTTASGDGLTKAVAGVANGFDVQTRDEFGNECADGGADIKCELEDEAGKKTSATVKDNGDGTYRVDYAPLERAGTYKVVTTLGGTPIKDAPHTLIVSPNQDDVSAEHSEASGDGLKVVVAGETGAFTVQVADRFGNKLKVGGATVKAFAAGTRTYKCAVADNGDGTYACTYVPEKTGDYKVHVAVQGSKLKASPFAVKVVPAKPAAPQSYADGRGLYKATVDTPGKEGSFVVTTRDRFENRCVEGGANLTVVLKGGSKDETIQGGVKDNKDGTYACDYDITYAGDYTMNVQIDGADIFESPFTVLARPGATEPSQTQLSDAKQKTAAGDDAFTLVLKDAKGNQRHKGGDTVKVKFEQVVVEEVDAIDNGDGTFRVATPAHLRGKVKATTVVDGKEAPVAAEAEVEEKPLSADEKALVAKAMPGTAAAFERALLMMSAAERAEVLAELKSGLKADSELKSVREKEAAERKAKEEAAAAEAAAKKKAKEEARAKRGAAVKALLEEAEAKEKAEAEAAAALAKQLEAELASADSAAPAAAEAPAAQQEAPEEEEQKEEKPPKPTQAAPSPKAKHVINELNRCHEVHSVAKFFGKCNQAKRDLDVCLQKEFDEHRRKKLAESRQRQAKFAAALKEREKEKEK